MTVIARDAVAADHLVYAWPLPLGPECEVSCADDEQVVMCPAWLVGDRLGPGRHRWRTPDPTRPVAAFFVLTSPVEASFDMTTTFVIPASGMPVRLRASGSVQVRCADPGLLIAQFVGLPFDHVNEGILRSVARSVERMLARLLTRRVVMAGTPYAVTDPAMLGQIVEELVAYNPTAGAVFGVELIRLGHLAIVADDGSSPYLLLPQAHALGDWSGQQHLPPMTPDPDRGSQPNLPGSDEIPLLETARGRPVSSMIPPAALAALEGHAAQAGHPGHGGHGGHAGHAGHAVHAGPAPAAVPPPLPPSVRRPSTHNDDTLPPPPGSTPRESFAVASGEIVVGRKKTPTAPGMPVPPAVTPLGTSPPGAKGKPVGHVEIPRSPDEITQPGVRSPLPGGPGIPIAAAPSPESGAILGIGVGAIGGRVGAVSGEIPLKFSPGQRVLVPGPNGLMQSATVRQLLQGYYELEVGSSGDTIWVPINGVVAE